MVISTDPDSWFLDEHQINRDPPYTAGNHVTPLVDGAAYMADLYNKFQCMGAGDYLHLTAWRISPQERLLRDGTDDRSFLEIIRDLIGNGVHVRAMIWHFPGSEIGHFIGPAHARGNIEFVSSVNNMRHRNGVAILDNRLPRGVFSSHHQKTAILNSGGTDYAYVGGTDIAVDRWDTPMHNSSRERTKRRYAAWHDVQSVICGPAVGQIWDNFTKRWNDSTSPHPRTMAPGGLTPPTIDLSTRPVNMVGTGSHFIQVLRTFAGSVYNFCPHGEQTVRAAYEKAIDKAEHYIYIEDQFFWPCSVVNKLGEAADRGVKIILVLACKSRSLINPWYNYLRNEALEHIRACHPGNVFVYNLQQRPDGNSIYVHSKLIIVDDCFSVLVRQTSTREAWPPTQSFR